MGRYVSLVQVRDAWACYDWLGLLIAVAPDDDHVINLSYIYARYREVCSYLAQLYFDGGVECW